MFFHNLRRMGILLGLALNKWLIEPNREVAAHLPASGFLNPTALLLMAAFLCANFVALVLLSWMPSFLYEKFGLSLAASGLTATIYVQLASMAGSPLCGWLAAPLRPTMPPPRMPLQSLPLT